MLNYFFNYPNNRYSHNVSIKKKEKHQKYLSLSPLIISVLSHQKAQIKITKNLQDILTWKATINMADNIQYALVCGATRSLIKVIVNSVH